MSKKLVAYFSATGTTEKVAHALAEAIGADVYEIEAPDDAVAEICFVPFTSRTTGV